MGFMRPVDLRSWEFFENIGKTRYRVVKIVVMGLFALSLSCGDPKLKERAEINSADALEAEEDIVAERPAVISGSHLDMCTQDVSVADSDFIKMSCSFKDSFKKDVDFEQFVKSDSLVVEINGEHVPIKIDEQGNFEFSLPKEVVPEGEEFSTESITVIDTKIKEEEESGDDDEKDGKIKDKSKEDEQAADDASEGKGGEETVEEGEEEAEEEVVAEDEAADEEEDDKGKGKGKGKDKNKDDEEAAGEEAADEED